MKRILKLTAIVLLLVFILIQFYPRASKNQDLSTASDISRIHYVPDSVQQILTTSCYDCHSNNTLYPWYSNIQPVSYWLNDHIVEGKKELNFSAFANYSVARQFKKMKEIAKEVKEDEMPLPSYTNIHRDAKLNAQQKLTLTSWATRLKDSMQNAYPPDSLLSKKK